jgi:hypothetical protein
MVKSIVPGCGVVDRRGDGMKEPEPGLALGQLVAKGLVRRLERDIGCVAGWR